MMMNTVISDAAAQNCAPVPLALLRQAVADLQAARPEVATIVPAALELLATRRFWPSTRPVGWWIAGRAADQDYIVVRVDGMDLCGCKQFVPRGGYCRHVVALELYRRLQDAPVIAPGRP
jgi:hypothetical protein